MNGTNASINQQVTTFKRISEAHAQINDFFAGQISDTNALPHEYPLLWIDLVDCSPFEVYTDYVWRVAVFDMLMADNSNEWEIRSDSNKVIKDILLILRDSFDLQVEWGKSKQMPVMEYLNDNLTGMYLDVTVSIPDDTALDQVPLKC
jgi:hypothetical protein